MVRVAAPVTERQAARLRPLGLLADNPEALVRAWQSVEAMWGATVERAASLPTARLDERVNGEWSFHETLRHLVFVTDAWIGAVVLERPSSYDSLGLPPDFVTNGAELGLDVGARPSSGEVLSARERGLALVREFLSSVSSEDLDRMCAPLGGQFSVLGAVQNVVFEEWAHHQYATRDLGFVQG